MRRLLTGILLIAGVAGVLAYGTRSFFSDTETSTGNQFVAGDIDLKIGNTSYYNGVSSPNTSWNLRDLTVERFFDFDDVKPGDYGEDTIEIQVGSNPAYVCANAQITQNLENGVTEPEDDLNDQEPDGELAQELNFAFWVDDGDNVYESGEQLITQGPASNVLNGGTLALADSDENVFNATVGAGIPAENSFYVGKMWCFGSLTGAPLTQDTQTNAWSPATDNDEVPGVDSRDGGWECDGVSATNIAQSDILVGDLSFYAVQTRNNPDFQCEDVDFPTPTPATVGQVLGSYSEPTTCTITVDDDNTTSYPTVQSGVNAASAGETVCVEAGSYDENVTIDRGITVLGLHDPAGGDKATITGRVDVTSDDVTFEGLEVTNPNVGYGIVVNGVSNVNVLHNVFTDIGTSVDDGSAQAIYINGTSSPISGFMIADNVVANVGSLSLTHGGSAGSGAKGVYIGTSSGQDTISDVTIQNNSFTNLNASTLPWAPSANGGAGAYGIAINYGAGGSSGVVSDVTISHNDISDLEGLWSHAIGLETDTPNTTVTYNDISDLTDHKSPSDAIAVFLEDNAQGATVLVNYNNLVANWGVALHPTTASGLVDAENNWWGDTDPSDNVAGPVDYIPYESAAFAN